MRRGAEGHRARRPPWWRGDRSHPHRRSGGTGLAVAAAMALLYAWWATGLTPFTAVATVAVAVPVAVVALVVVARPGRTTAGDIGPGAAPPRRRWEPWAVLAAVAVSLETVALVLGGRSATVPTLSTVVDHALGRHAVRGVLFCLWMAVGASAAVRVARRRGGAA